MVKTKSGQMAVTTVGVEWKIFDFSDGDQQRLKQGQNVSVLQQPVNGY